VGMRGSMSGVIGAGSRATEKGLCLVRNAFMIRLQNLIISNILVNLPNTQRVN
jgi:hypothetical protein